MWKEKTICEHEVGCLRRSSGCKMQKKLNQAMDNAYRINPKKRLWGSRLSILCLLGDQWRAPILADSSHT